MLGAALAAAVVSAQPPPPPPCPDDAPGAMCVIANATVSLSTSYALTLNGSITFISSQITLAPCLLDPTCAAGSLELLAGGNVTFINTTIAAPTIVIAAANVTLDSASALIADGSGPIVTRQIGPAGEVDGVYGTGGGHGGSGGYIVACHTGAPAPKVCGQGFGFSNASYPFAFGGASSGFSSGLFEASHGGGRIAVEAAYSVVVSGLITADGQSSVDNTGNCQCGPGGGGGGSITVGAQLINITSTGYFSAQGGSATYTGGGGGGAVSFQAVEIFGATADVVNVAGGATVDVRDYPNCPVGGTGLFYHQQTFQRAQWIGGVAAAAAAHATATAVLPRSRFMRRHPRWRDTIVSVSPSPLNRIRADTAAVWASCLRAQAATRRVSVRECPAFDASAGAGSPASADFHSQRSERYAAVRARLAEWRAGLVPYERAVVWAWRNATSSTSLHGSGTNEARLVTPALARAQAFPRSSDGVIDPWSAAHVAMPLRHGGLSELVGVPSDEHLCYLAHADVVPANYADTFLCGTHDADADVAAGTTQPPLAATPTATLQCNSFLQRAITAPLTQTTVDSLGGATVIEMSNCAWDLSSITTLTLATWKIASSSLQVGDLTLTVNSSVSISDLSRAYTAGTGMALDAALLSGLTITQSLLNAGLLRVVSPASVVVGTQGYLRFAFRANFTAGAVTVSNVVSQVDIPPVPTALIIAAINMTVNLEASVVAGSVFILAANALLINGAIGGVGTFIQGPSCPSSGPPYTPVPAILPIACSNLTMIGASGFAIWLLADSIDVQKSGVVQASAIRMCANTLTVENGGMVTAAGLGCGAEAGFGAGASTSGEPSSGAGHGGLGGAGVGSDGTVTLGGPFYDNVTQPVMIGSGGGDPAIGGGGGGLVWLDVASQLENDGIVAAGGVDGGPATGPGSGGGGGGSGGSAIVRVANLTGAVTGVFDFSGGAGGAPGGGGGSGGVVNVYWYDGETESAQQRMWYACLAGHLVPRMLTAASTSPPLASPIAMQFTGQPGDGIGLMEDVWGRDLTIAAEACNLAPAVPVAAAAAVAPRLGRAAGNQYSGDLRNMGGSGSQPGTDGSHGLSTSEPACNVGEGGAFCLPCPSGSYKNSSGDNLPCSPCAPGFASNATGAVNCTQCDADSIAPLSGAAVCASCSGGFLPDPTHTSCTLCRPGFGGFNCEPCPAGYYKNDTTTQPCSPCSAGTYAELEGQLSCQACAPGTFMPDPGATQCKQCGAGTISLPPYTACTPCPAGSASDPDMNSCDICDAGTFAPAASAACTPCDVGFYSLGNASLCDTCPPKPPHSSWTRKQVVLSASSPWTPGMWVPRYGSGADPLPPNISAIFCSFTCDTGFVEWPHCVIPVQAAYDALGGMTGITVLGVIALVLGLPAWIWTRPPSQTAALYAWVPDITTADSVVAAAAAATSAAGGPRLKTGNVEIDAYFGTASYDRLLRHANSGDGGCCGGGRSRGGGAFVQRRNRSGRLAAMASPPQAVGSLNGGRMVGGVRSPLGAAVDGGPDSDSDDGGGDDGGSARSPPDGDSPSGAAASRAAAVAAAAAAAAGGRGRAQSFESRRSGRHRARSGMGDGTSSVAGGGGLGLYHTRYVGGGGIAAAELGGGGRAGGAIAGSIDGDSIGGGGGGGGAVGAGGGRSMAGRGGRGGRSAATDDAPPTLPVTDLPRHLHRLFFAGTNTPAHPLRLEPRIPPELAGAVLEHEFLEHVEETAELARWRSWEVRIANMLRLLAHPLALAFERSRRAVHIAKLARRYAEYDHSFLRNTRARALGNCVRFGHSYDHTLAWIDVLVGDLGEDVGGAPVGKPHFPACLPFAGDGSFACPYHLELHDPINVAHVALLAPDFASIAIGLNNLLRRFRGPVASPGLRLAPREEDGESATASHLRLLSLRDGTYSSQSFLRGASYAMATGMGAPGMPAGSLQAAAAGSASPLVSGGGGGGGLAPPASAYVAMTAAAPADGVGGSRPASGALSPSADSAAGFGFAGGGAGGGASLVVGRPGVCCGGYAQNNSPDIETQRHLRNVDDYVRTVNSLLAARWSEGIAALELLQDAHRRGSIAVTTGHRGSSFVEVMSATDGRKHSFPLPRHRPTGSGGVLAGLLPLLMQPPPAPVRTTAALSDAVGSDTVDPDEVERALAALQLVPFGFPHTQLCMYVGKMHRDVPGMHPSVSKPCLLLLPASMVPDATGVFASYVPYQARAARATAAASMFASLAVLPARLRGMAAGGAGSAAIAGGAAGSAGDAGAGGSGAGMELRSHQRTASATSGTFANPLMPPSGYATAGSDALERGFYVDMAASSSSASGRPASIRSSGSGGSQSGGGGRRGGGRGARSCAACPACCAGPLAGCIRVFTAAGHYVPALRNSRAASSWEVITLALAVLMLFNVGATALTFAGALTLTGHLGPVLMMAPPAVFLVAPAVGLLALARGSPTLHRVHSSFEVLALLPTAIAVTSGAVYTIVGPYDYQLGVIFPVALLLIKLALLRLTNVRVALLELYAEAAHTNTAAIAYVRELMASAPMMPSIGVPTSVAGGGMVDAAGSLGMGGGSGSAAMGMLLSPSMERGGMSGTGSPTEEGALGPYGEGREAYSPTEADNGGYGMGGAETAAAGSKFAESGMLGDSRFFGGGGGGARAITPFHLAFSGAATSFYSTAGTPTLMSDVAPLGGVGGGGSGGGGRR